MATPNKDDPKKNVEANRAGTAVNKNVASIEDKNEPSQEEKDEEAAQEDERKAYKARMDYATKVHNSDEPIYLKQDEDDMATQLFADGFAELRAQQIGMETKNWIELTPEGLRAVQAYNTQED